MLPSMLLSRWLYFQFWTMVTLSTKWHQALLSENWTLFITQPSTLPLMCLSTLITVTSIKLVGRPSLHTRQLHHWFHFIFKTVLGKIPPYLSSLLHVAHNKYCTRSSEYIKFTIPFHSAAFGCNSFHFAAANDWNTLQSSLRLAA